MNTRSRHGGIRSVLLPLLGVLCLCCFCGGCAGSGGSDPSEATTAAPPTETINSAHTEENDMDVTTEGSDQLTTYRVTAREDEEELDFILDLPAGKDPVILQITDTQIQTMAGVRNETRRIQVGNAFFSSLPDDFEFRVWRYVDEAVEKARPDLIVLTGDNIYGELDDSGELWRSLIEKMDSYGIPWCAVFGNHDNESGKGVLWQVEQLLGIKNGIFRRGDVSGNSNYNLLIRQGGEAKYLLYMLDSNGCTTKPHNPGEGMMPDNVDIDQIQQTAGFRNDQIAWMTQSAKSIRQDYGEVSVLLFYHIPVSDIPRLVQKAYPGAASAVPFSPDRAGDFGTAKEPITGAAAGRFWNSAQSIGCTGMFVGHQHEVATSIVCDGIRVTYGLKTGTYDYHDEELLGSTKITLSENGGTFAVEYLYSELPYRR